VEISLLLMLPKLIVSLFVLMISDSPQNFVPEAQFNFFKKMVSASGGFAPLAPWSGALPLDPAGGTAPDPHYRLTLPHSPWPVRSGSFFSTIRALPMGTSGPRGKGMKRSVRRSEGQKSRSHEVEIGRN